METAILEKIGLTKGEIKAYLALLKSGPGAAGMVAKNSGVSRSKVYLVMDSLEKKGMASHVDRRGVRCFQAVEPAKIRDYIRERQEEYGRLDEEFGRFLPSLEAFHSQQGSTQNITVYQGFKGLRVAHEHLYLKLKRGEVYCALGAPGAKTWQALERFWRSDHSRRAAQGIRCRILFNADVERKVIAHRNSLPLCEARYMPTGMVTPAEIEVFKDTTLIITISAEPITMEIVSREIADSFRSYFDQFWKRSKPLAGKKVRQTQ
ncbi:MAG: helix-turn-helix domain-containing protein [Candidatus Micrarchaeota archaeon]